MGCEIFKITARREDNSADVTAEREDDAVSIYAVRADKAPTIATQLQRAEVEISATWQIRSTDTSECEVAASSECEEVVRIRLNKSSSYARLPK